MHADMSTEAKFEYCEQWGDYELDFEPKDPEFLDCADKDGHYARIGKALGALLFLLMVVMCLMACCIYGLVQRKKKEY
jgi:hypothetical protein